MQSNSKNSFAYTSKTNYTSVRKVFLLLLRKLQTKLNITGEIQLKNYLQMNLFIHLRMAEVIFHHQRFVANLAVVHRYVLELKKNATKRT